MKNPIKLMVVDDQSLFRHGLTRLFEAYDEVTVIAEAENGQDALNALTLCNPDVILLDIDMPIMNGNEATKRIKKEYPGIKILILSLHEESYYVLELIKSGADGYISKNDNMDTVLSAIEIVNSGGIYLNEKLSEFLEITTDLKRPINSFIGELALNKEEIKLLKLICKGKNGKEIASILNISLRTYNNRKDALKSKTNCRSDTDFVFYALRHGIINYDGGREN